MVSSIGQMRWAKEAHMICLTRTHQGKASRLKARGIPSLGSYELQPRMSQMSNQQQVEVSPDVLDVLLELLEL